MGNFGLNDERRQYFGQSITEAEEYKPKYPAKSI